MLIGVDRVKVKCIHSSVFLHSSSSPPPAQSPGGWTLVPVGPIVTALRECETLARVGGGGGLLHDDLLAAILRPDEAAVFGTELAQVCGGRASGGLGGPRVAGELFVCGGGGDGRAGRYLGFGGMGSRRGGVLGGLVLTMAAWSTGLSSD